MRIGSPGNASADGARSCSQGLVWPLVPSVLDGETCCWLAVLVRVGTKFRAKPLASVESRAPSPPAAERRCRRGHDVLHGACAASAPLRLRLRAGQGRRRRAHGGLRSRRARRVGSRWARRLSVRREAGGFDRRRGDGLRHARVRPRRKRLGARGRTGSRRGSAARSPGRARSPGSSASAPPDGEAR